MNELNPYFKEVIDAHLAIEGWLSGLADDGGLAPLLERFSPAFTMVAPSGNALSYAELKTMFSNGRGSRLGLRMQIDDFRLLSHWHGGGCVSYRETQAIAAGQVNIRRSTAIFETSADGRIVWRHLQETLVQSS